MVHFELHTCRFDFNQYTKETGNKINILIDLRKGGKNTQKNCTKKIFMTQIIMKL